jgi:glutathione synthase/RimK-type ligase-like ATP-grasp enzyme
VAWDDPRQRWSDFDAVVVRSTWDAVDRPEEYLAWAKFVDGETILINPRAAIAGTLDKHFLSDLAAAGVKLPRTTFVAGNDGWQPPNGDFVVKPAISGGGRETALYREAELDDARRHVDRLLGQGRDVIVQEHLAAVHSRGEIKLVLIGGRFSHAIRTGPLLRHGAGVLDRPWEVPTGAEPITPTAAELAFAEDVVRQLESHLSTSLAYARIDVVSRSADDVVLMEAEVIDPSLSLWASASAPSLLASSIASRL